MAVRILLGYLIFSDEDNRLDQSYPVQNVIEGQGDSIHNTASQIGHSEPHQPNVEGNLPQSNRFYCINTKAIELYAPGLEQTSKNEFFFNIMFMKEAPPMIKFIFAFISRISRNTLVWRKSLNNRKLVQWFPYYNNTRVSVFNSKKRWCFYRSNSCTFGSFVSTGNIYR